MSNQEKNIIIPSFLKADTVLNTPGQFSFQLEDEDIKLGKNSIINKKKIEEIIENIRMIFKSISKGLDDYFKKFDYSYYSSIIKKLNNFSNSKTLRFPGLQVINMSRDHIEVFSKIPERILICEKSDGVRYLLIHFANNKVLFLGRNLEFFLVDINEGLPSSGNANKSDWEIENLLDGELIIDKINKSEEEILSQGVINSNIIKINNEYFEAKFIIFDAIVVLGVNIGHIKFRDRLKNLSEFFFLKDLKRKFVDRVGPKMENSIAEAVAHKSQYSLAAHNISRSPSRFSIDIFMKDYFTFDKFEFLYDKITKMLNHHNDGVIINLDDYPYYSGQSAEIYKWKPANLNTIDFEVSVMDFGDNKKLFLLKVNESRDKMLPVSCLFFHSDKEREDFLTAMEEQRLSGKPIIVECFYDFAFNSDEIINFHMLNEAKIIRKEGPGQSYGQSEGLYNLNNYNFEYFESKRGNRKHFELGAWQFMRFRKDKKDPNSLYTYIQVWNAIMENVQMKDITDKIKENDSRKIKLEPNKVVSTYVKESNTKYALSSDDEFTPIADNSLHKGKETSNKSNPAIFNTSSNLKGNIISANEDFLKKKRTKVEEGVKKIKTEESMKKPTISIGPPAISKKEMKQRKDAEKKEKGMRQSSQMLDRAFAYVENRASKNTFEAPKKNFEEEKAKEHTQTMINNNQYSNSLLDDDDSLEESLSE